MVETASFEEAACIEMMALEKRSEKTKGRRDETARIMGFSIFVCFCSFSY